MSECCDAPVVVGGISNYDENGLELEFVCAECGDHKYSDYERRGSEK